MNTIEDLFNIPESQEQPIKMTVDDFVSKTRDILKKIESEYGKAYQWRRLAEEDYETQDCDNCTGECELRRNGILSRCVPDIFDGECFVSEIQYETFLEEIENIMFNNTECYFYELLICDVIKDESNEPRKTTF